MQVAVELPDEILSQLLPAATAPSRALLEAIVLEAYREGRLDLPQAQLALGIETRHEMDGFLKEHRISQGGYDAEQLLEDVNAMDTFAARLRASKA